MKVVKPSNKKRNRETEKKMRALTVFFGSGSGLPDFSWYVTPEPEKMHQLITKCTKWSLNILNVCKILRITLRYINIFLSNPTEFTQIVIFGLKVTHLATLLRLVSNFRSSFHKNMS
jgi:hypothetical protein